MKKLKRKKTMKKAAICLITMTLLFALPVSHTLCFAEWSKKGHGDDRKHEAMKNVIAELGLTTEQQSQIDAQRESQKKQAEKLRTKLQAERTLLKEELNKPSINRRAVNDLVKKINAIRGDMFRQRIDGIIAMKGILTPEQYAEMKGRMEKMREKHKRRKGRRKEKEE